MKDSQGGGDESRAVDNLTVKIHIITNSCQNQVSKRGGSYFSRKPWNQIPLHCSHVSSFWANQPSTQVVSTQGTLMLVSEYTSSHSKNPHNNKEGGARTPNVSYTQAELSEWKVMYWRLKPEKTCQADSTGKIERPVQRGRSSLGQLCLPAFFSAVAFWLWLCAHHEWLQTTGRMTDSKTQGRHVPSNGIGKRQSFRI